MRSLFFSLSVVGIALSGSIAFADSCLVHSVMLVNAMEQPLRAQAEQILVEKGYQIVDDGQYFTPGGNSDSDNVLTRNIVKPGEYLAIFNGQLSNSLLLYPSAGACYSVYGNANCDFGMSLYRQSQDGNLVKIWDVFSS